MTITFDRMIIHATIDNNLIFLALNQVELAVDDSSLSLAERGI
jgi:hypothetical protein